MKIILFGKFSTSICVKEIVETIVEKFSSRESSFLFGLFLSGNKESYISKELTEFGKAMSRI